MLNPSPVVNYLNDMGYKWIGVQASWYYSNVLLFPRKTVGDEIVVSFPMPDNAPMVGFAVEQIGLWVRYALNNTQKYTGKCRHPQLAFGQRSSKPRRG